MCIVHAPFPLHKSIDLWFTMRFSGLKSCARPNMPKPHPAQPHSVAYFWVLWQSAKGGGDT